MEVNIFLSDGWNFFFLWMLFVSIIIFALSAYFYSRWNILGPKFKKRFAKRNKTPEEKLRTQSTTKQLEVIEKKILDAEENNLNSQEILTLQSEKDRILKNQEREKLVAEELMVKKVKEEELKQKLKENKKAQKTLKNSSSDFKELKVSDNNEDGSLLSDLEQVEKLDSKINSRKKEILSKHKEMYELIKNVDISKKNKRF